MSENTQRKKARRDNDVGEHKKYWGSVSYAAIAGPFPSL